jgi:hypothetical protein
LGLVKVTVLDQWRRQQMSLSTSIGVMSASRLRYDEINAVAARRSKPIRSDSIRQMPLRPGTSCVGIQTEGDPTLAVQQTVPHYTTRTTEVPRLSFSSTITR